jgi:Ohr subfamily peroxiredoxin
MERAMGRGDKLLYKAKVHTTGGREGDTSRSDEGRLDIKHLVPGTSAMGTSPEQLFAGGWSTCYESAMAIASRKMKVAHPDDLAIDAELVLCTNVDGHFLQDSLNVSPPRVARQVAQLNMDVGEQVGPYSRATRGNADVAIALA